MNEQNEFELIRNEPFIKIQRKLGLIPRNSLGVLRRSLFFGLICWLPILIWGISNNRIFEATSGEPLVRQFAIHVMCLIAIPCLILSEAYALKIMNKIMHEFISCEMIHPQEIHKFHRILKNTAQLRDKSFPWFIVLGLSLTWIFAVPKEYLLQELDWAIVQNEIQFGGWWYLYVVRAIFFTLLLGWIWRVGLLVVLFRKISGLNLQLVPTHPDGFGGIGFIFLLPQAFSLLTLAVSAIIAANWLHQALYHAVPIRSFQVPLAVFVVIWLGILTLPICLFIPKLASHKKQAIAEYRALIAKHGRLVHQKWVTGENNEPSPLLQAPELGSIADIRVAYDSVIKMKVIPFTLSSMIDVVSAIAIPMIIVLATQIPISKIITTLVKAIV